MRVTQGVLFQRTLSNLQNTLFRLTETREQAFTGKNFIRPSQDPVGAARLLSAKSESERIGQYLDNIGSVQSLLEASTTSLQNVSGSLIDIKEKILAAASDTTNQGDRALFAEEVKQFLAELVSQANTAIQGLHVFGGTQTGEPPFVFDSQGRVQYVGDKNSQTVPVGPGLVLPLSLSGDSVFLDPGSRELNLDGETGAAAGRTQSTGTGTAFLDIAHTATFYGDEALGGGDSVSGLVPGASSASGDTILGLSHSVQLTVNPDGSGTISLNNAPPVEFTGTETDLEVLGASGETIFVDVTSVVPGFDGTVSARTEGTLNLEGAAPVAIGFTDNDEIVDGDGNRTYIDTTGLRIAGREVTTYVGSLDIFELTQTIIDDLERPGSLNTEEQGDVLRSRLLDFERAEDMIRNSLSILGAKAARLESVENHVEDVDLNLRTLVSDIEDVDLASVILQLTQLENTYQASLEIGSRTFSLSLLNFI